MIFQITYPSLRCVLEYLDPNKRIHIVGRSPALQRFDKSVPIHMEYLCAECDKVVMDDKTYRLLTKASRHLYSRKQKKFDFWFEKSTRGPFSPIDGHLPVGMRFHQATECLSRVLLSYNLVYTKSFAIDLPRYSKVRLSASSIIHTRHLTIEKEQLLKVLSFLHPSSFPLKSLSSDASVQLLNHPVVKQAEKLKFADFDNWIFPRPVQTLANKYVTFYEPVPEEEIIGLIDYWIENQKEVGTRFKLKIDYDANVKEMVLQIQDRFGGTFSEEQSINGKLVELWISMNSTSELHIEGTEYNYLKLIVEAKVEVSTQLTYPSFQCILEYLDTNKRIHIAARSRVLRRHEKSIPRYIDTFHIHHNGFSIGNIGYRLYYTWDSCWKDYFSPFAETPSNGWLEIKFDKNIEKFGDSRKVHHSFPRYEAYQHIYATLWGYSTVRVDNLHVTRKQDDMRNILSFIDISSVQLPRSVVIHGDINLISKAILPKIKNKHVEMKGIKCSQEVVLDLIDNWLIEGKAEGSSFQLETFDNISDLFESIKGRFNGEFRYQKYRLSSHCVSISVSSKLELNIVHLRSDILKIRVEAKGSLNSKLDIVSEDKNGMGTGFLIVCGLVILLAFVVALWRIFC